MHHGVRLALALALAGCVAPSQADPSVYGTIRVALGDSLDGVWSWSPDQRRALTAALPQLDALGPAWVLTDEGTADVVVRAASLRGGCGGYDPGLAFVEVDAACTSRVGGFLALTRAVHHELFHYYLGRRFGWYGHLCRRAADRADCHATIECDDCLLSPGLAQPDEGPGFESAYVPTPSESAPAAADLELVRRCAARGCR
jgi:hypothetical protein